MYRAYLGEFLERYHTVAVGVAELDDGLKRFVAHLPFNPAALCMCTHGRARRSYRVRADNAMCLGMSLYLNDASVHSPSSS